MVICVEEPAGELRFNLPTTAGYRYGQGAQRPGVQDMIDRMAALGGSLNLRSGPGGGTEVSGRLPAQMRQQTPAPT